MTVSDLHVSFATEEGVVQAVDGVSFDIEPGEVVAIVGESGSGKSVTAMTLLGLTRSPNARFEGSAVFDGTELLTASEHELEGIRGNGIAMVFQDPMSSLDPVYRVGDQIVEQIRAHEPDLPRGAAYERAVELLGRVGIPRPAERARSFPHEFSGGMRQRVMIAMALSCSPELLIADEPTTALDVTIQAQILRELRALREETGAAIIMVTHDLGVVADIADRVLVMYAGRRGRAGHAGRAVLRPAAPVHVGAAGVDRAARPRPLAAAAGDPGLAPVAAVTAVGLSLPAALPARVRQVRGGAAAGRARPLLAAAGGEARAADGRRRDRPRVRDDGDVMSGAARRSIHLQVHFPVRSGLLVSRTVGRVHAVDDVSFALQEGETLGIVGESGCGKSTLIRALMRLVDATGGSIRFRGVDITDAGRRELAPVRRELQMVFQDPQASLNPRKRVGQIVGLPLRLRGVSDVEQRSRELLARVGLNPEHLNRFPHEFSGGQRQRIGIARALAAEPKAILLDEPVSALDVSIQAQVVNLLEELQDEFGLSYVFVAHDLSVVRHVSDRIVVMYLGKIVEVSPAEELYDKPIHPYTVGLLGAIPIPDPRENRARPRAGRRGRAAVADRPAARAAASTPAARTRPRSAAPSNRR